MAGITIRLLCEECLYEEEQVQLVYWGGDAAILRIPGEDGKPGKLLLMNWTENRQHSEPLPPRKKPIHTFAVKDFGMGKEGNSAAVDGPSTSTTDTATG